MTKPPTRGSLLRKIERLEKQIQLLESMRSIDAIEYYRAGLEKSAPS